MLFAGYYEFFFWIFAFTMHKIFVLISVFFCLDFNTFLYFLLYSICYLYLYIINFMYCTDVITKRTSNPKTANFFVYVLRIFHYIRKIGYSEKSVITNIFPGKWPFVLSGLDCTFITRFHYNTVDKMRQTSYNTVLL